MVLLFTIEFQSKVENSTDLRDCKLRYVLGISLTLSLCILMVLLELSLALFLMVRARWMFTFFSSSPSSFSSKFVWGLSVEKEIYIYVLNKSMAVLAPGWRGA